MRRITPRTCLWPMVGCLCATFVLSFGLTFQSDHHCYAGTCGEWLFPFQARLHVVVWYLWLSLSVLGLSLRAFQPSIRTALETSLGVQVPIMGKRLRVSGIALTFWVASLYGILIGIWWVNLRDYFEARAQGLPGNQVVAAVAMTGHLADVTMGMVLLPVSRHSALASFFKLSPTSTYTFHMTQAYTLFAIIIIHGSLYADWASLYNGDKDLFRHVLPVLNPTYLYHEVWPGSDSALGIWRASLIFTGIVSSLIMMCMFFTSFPVVRNRHFNLFYFTHLFGIVAVVIICLHASTMFYCTIPGLSMWLLDWSMRIYELRQKLSSQVQGLGNGWYTLTLYLPRKRLSGCACHSPLAHFYIHHSESSLREIHPFTTITHLASQKTIIQDGAQSLSIRFLFRESSLDRGIGYKVTQWTTRLASVVDEENVELKDTQELSTPGSRTTFETSFDAEGPKGRTSLRLEGPYFTPANPERFKTAVCLVAGTGLSGAIAISAAFASQSRPFNCNSQTESATANSSSTCAVSARETPYWSRCIVIWVVKKQHYVNMPFFEELKCDGLEITVHKTGGQNTRPNLDELLKEACPADGEGSWCYISGPNRFISSAERACSQLKSLKSFAARWD